MPQENRSQAKIRLRISLQNDLRLKKLHEQQIREALKLAQADKVDELRRDLRWCLEDISEIESYLKDLDNEHIELV